MFAEQEIDRKLKGMVDGRRFLGDFEIPYGILSQEVSVTEADCIGVAAKEERTCVNHRAELIKEILRTLHHNTDILTGLMIRINLRGFVLGA